MTDSIGKRLATYLAGPLKTNVHQFKQNACATTEYVDMHNIGTTLIQEKTGTGGSTVLFSEWFPREGDNAVFAYEEIMAEQSTLLVQVWEKNVEQQRQGEVKSGTFSQDGDFNNIKYANFLGLKEMIRYRIEVKDGNWTNGPCFAIYRMLEPTWFNTEDAS